MEKDLGNTIFFTSKEMEDEMVKRWNTAVGTGDTVYILGDFCWGNEREWNRILDLLCGKKILVRGNHDLRRFSDLDSLHSKLVDVCDYMEIEDAGRHVVLSHYPIVCFNNHFHGWYHLYGHVHTSFEAQMMEHDKLLMQDLYQREHRMYNVGCMVPYMNYTPKTLTDIISGAKEAERKCQN